MLEAGKAKRFEACFRRRILGVGNRLGGEGDDGNESSPFPEGSVIWGMKVDVNSSVPNIEFETFVASLRKTASGIYRSGAVKGGWGRGRRFRNYQCRVDIQHWWGGGMHGIASALRGRQ